MACVIVLTALELSRSTVFVYGHVECIWCLQIKLKTVKSYLVKA